MKQLYSVKKNVVFCQEDQSNNPLILTKIKIEIENENDSTSIQKKILLNKVTDW